jgi:hypothetical protein
MNRRLDWWLTEPMRPHRKPRRFRRHNHPRR